MEQKETQRSLFDVGEGPPEPPVTQGDAEAGCSGEVVSVLVPYAVAGTYSYLVPTGSNPALGSVVTVPLGTRTVLGAVWDRHHDEAINPARLRPLEAILPARPLSPSLRAFVDWVADYTLTPPGMVLRMVLRSPRALEPEKPIPAVRLAGPPPERMTSARKRVLDVLADDMAWSRMGLATMAGVSPSVIDGLLDAGTLEWVELPPQPAVIPPDPDCRPATLSEAQADAAGALVAAVASGGFSATLLDGVTGAGK